MTSMERTIALALIGAYEKLGCGFGAFAVRTLLADADDARRLRDDVARLTMAVGDEGALRMHLEEQNERLRALLADARPIVQAFAARTRGMQQDLLGARDLLQKLDALFGAKS